MKRILSVILVLAMTLSLCSTAFAAERVGYDSEEVTATDIELARNAYNELSPEAKAIFDKALASDMEMLEFHKAYVDPNTDIEYAPNYSVRSAGAVAADPMAILKAEFAIMQLPEVVKYVLEAMGAGMVAAIGDGPLLVGDILLAATTVSAAIVIAANWKTVAPKWNRIVNAFKKAFAASVSNVISAFESLRGNVQKEYQTKFRKSAEDALGNVDSNKQNHILKNKLHKNGHDWKKIFNGKDPDWKSLVPILLKAFEEGKEHPYNGSTTVFEREILYKGVTVVVRFVKDAEGFVKWLSTAYLK